MAKVDLVICDGCGEVCGNGSQEERTHVLVVIDGESKLDAAGSTDYDQETRDLCVKCAGFVISRLFKKAPKEYEDEFVSGTARVGERFDLTCIHK